MQFAKGYEAPKLVNPFAQKEMLKFWLKQDAETNVIILDDEPIQVIRHHGYFDSDFKMNSHRVTCKDLSSPSPSPQSCPVCAAMAKGRMRGVNLRRSVFYYYTVIDEGAYTHNNKQYSHQKRLLEVNESQIDLIQREIKLAATQAGSQAITAKYLRMNVFRSKASKSPRIGDRWRSLGYIDPIQHLWREQAITRIVDAARERGKPFHNDPQQERALAIQKLVSPVNYGSELANSDDKIKVFMALLPSQGTTNFGYNGPVPSVMPGSVAAPTPPSATYQLVAPGQAPQMPPSAPQMQLPPSMPQQMPMQQQYQQAPAAPQPMPQAAPQMQPPPPAAPSFPQMPAQQQQQQQQPQAQPPVPSVSIQPAPTGAKPWEQEVPPSVQPQAPSTMPPMPQQPAPAAQQQQSPSDIPPWQTQAAPPAPPTNFGSIAPSPVAGGGGAISLPGAMPLPGAAPAQGANTPTPAAGQYAPAPQQAQAPQLPPAFEGF